MPAIRHFSLSSIYVISLILISALILGSCSRDDRSRVNAPDTTCPAITAAITPESLPVEPGGQITINIASDLSSDRVAGIRYSITGMVNQQGSLEYGQLLNSVSETISIQIPQDATPDSSFTLTVQVRDISGNVHCIIREFYPLDNQPPEVTLMNTSGWSCWPGGSFPIRVTASDNVALKYIALSTAGAFAWNDTLKFEAPYPVEIDTIISILIPSTGFLSFNFWISAEAVDVNFNSAIVSPENEVGIIFNGITTVVHPVGCDINSVKRGDTLRFWVVGYSNHPLTCLGYRIYYSKEGSWNTIFSRDSVFGDFDNIDSACFSFYVPDTGYCENIIYLHSFAYNTTCCQYTVNYNFLKVEYRIRLSQATIFESASPDISALMAVDDRRNLVYVTSGSQNRIKVYSQLSQQFLDPIELPCESGPIYLSPDTNSILMTNSYGDRLLSIIDIDASEPHFDTTISLPGWPLWLAPLSDGTALISADFDNNCPCGILRMNLSDYSMDTLDLGIDSYKILVASGNSEYALISAGTTNYSQLFLYQANVGVIATGNVDWNVERIAANHDGSRFFILDWGSSTNSIIDRNLTIIDSVPAQSCSQLLERGLFSRDGHDLYLISFNSIGHVRTEPWTFEGYFSVWPRYESIDFIQIATNATDDRLFVTGQGPEWTKFTFWDIPIDPE